MAIRIEVSPSLQLESRLATVASGGRRPIALRWHASGEIPFSMEFVAGLCSVLLARHDILRFRFQSATRVDVLDMQSAVQQMIANFVEIRDVDDSDSESLAKDLSVSFEPLDLSQGLATLVVCIGRSGTIVTVIVAVDHIAMDERSFVGLDQSMRDILAGPHIRHVDTRYDYLAYCHEQRLTLASEEGRESVAQAQRSMDTLGGYPPRVDGLLRADQCSIDQPTLSERTTAVSWRSLTTTARTERVSVYTLCMASFFDALTTVFDRRVPAVCAAVHGRSKVRYADSCGLFSFGVPITVVDRESRLTPSDRRRIVDAEFATIVDGALPLVQLGRRFDLDWTNPSAGAAIYFEVRPRRRAEASTAHRGEFLLAKAGARPGMGNDVFISVREDDTGTAKATAEFDAGTVDGAQIDLLLTSLSDSLALAMDHR
ncbi:condensation domain-containing protein [Nocardia sp. IBHARD005]|uniref:condensation domain-containing protein n=1 Tax=Nocardia sp. IBHARD005 TaxID=3457765 RepID=UPI004058C8BB